MGINERIEKLYEEERERQQRETELLRAASRVADALHAHGVNASDAPISGWLLHRRLFIRWILSRLILIGRISVGRWRAVFFWPVGGSIRRQEISIRPGRASTRFLLAEHLSGYPSYEKSSLRRERSVVRLFVTGRVGALPNKHRLCALGVRLSVNLAGIGGRLHLAISQFRCVRHIALAACQMP